MINSPEGGINAVKSEEGPFKEEESTEKNLELSEEEKEELAPFTFGHLVKFKTTSGEIEKDWVVVSSVDSISSKNKKFFEENKDQVIIQKRRPGFFDPPLLNTTEKVIPKEKMEKSNPSASEAEDRPFSKRFMKENIIILKRRIERGEEKEDKIIELRGQLDELEEKLTIVEKQEEIKAGKIAQANTLNELEETVRAMGLIENDEGGIYEVSKIAFKIVELEGAKKLRFIYNTVLGITRTLGLRDKVIELLEKERGVKVDLDGEFPSEEATIDSQE